MTASVSYAKENGVAPVEVRTIVLHDHKMSGSSFIRLPLAFSNCFLSVLTMVLFVDLAWPFVCRCLSVTKLSLMFHLEQNSWNPKLMNCEPLSVTISYGTPNP